MPKDENFITIQGWMRNKLHLKGNELMIYALVYGFTQDGRQEFCCSRDYVCDWVGCTAKTVTLTLSALVEKGLLIKQDTVMTNGLRGIPHYKANLTVLQNVTHEGKNVTHINIDNNRYINSNNTRARGNRFNNFDQRTYDASVYEALMRGV